MGLRPSTHNEPVAHALAATRSPRSLRKRTLDVSEDPATLYVLHAVTPRESLPGEGRRNSQKSGTKLKVTRPAKDNFCCYFTPNFCGREEEEGVAK